VLMDIIVTDKITAVWGRDVTGVKYVLNIIETENLTLPRTAATGLTGADLGWTAYPTARVTLDRRAR